MTFSQDNVKFETGLPNISYLNPVSMKNHDQSGEIAKLRRGLVQCEKMILETDDTITREFLQKLCQVYESLIRVQRRCEKLEKENHLVRASAELVQA